tara:strand:+ start:100 stop:315 length:216 start_codon:yes stop_codon:yes gene_type:complete
VPEEEAWRASVDEKNFEEKRERAEQELENLESLLTEEIGMCRIVFIFIHFPYSCEPSSFILHPFFSSPPFN